MPNDKIFETDKLDDSEFNLVAPEEPEIRRVGSGEKRKINITFCSLSSRLLSP